MGAPGSWLPSNKPVQVRQPAPGTSGGGLPSGLVALWKEQEQQLCWLLCSCTSSSSPCAHLTLGSVIHGARHGAWQILADWLTFGLEPYVGFQR